MRWLLLMLIAPLALSAQTIIKSLPQIQEITSVAVDRPGDIYLSLSNGEIKHISVDGELLSTQTSPPPDLFDPRDGARLFAYYRKTQRYDYVSPSFEVTKSVNIDSALVAEAWLVCPSGDYNIWAIDAADKTLKKINPSSSEIIAEVPLKGIDNLSSVKFMREYQGFLFLHDINKGIVVFNGMGRQLRIIGDSRISYFNFIGEELYYKEGNNIQLFNLFTAEARTIVLQKPASIALMTDERLYLINPKLLEVFTPIH